MDRDDAFLLGGNLGMLFDDTLFVGGAGTTGAFYATTNYGSTTIGTNGYGGLLVEWHALRSPVVSLSARGLIGGGIATVGGRDDVYYRQAVRRPKAAATRSTRPRPATTCSTRDTSSSSRR